MTLINTKSKGSFSEDTSQTYHNFTDYRTCSPPPQHLPEIESLSSETLLFQESDSTSQTFLVDKTISNEVDLSEKFEENLSSETLWLEEHRTEAINSNFSTTEDDSETLRETNKRRRSDSKLFQKIKERYERNTARPTEEDTPGLKGTRRTNETNIQSYPDVVLESFTRFNISDKPPPLHGNDLELPKYVEVKKEKDTKEKNTVEEEKEEKLPSSPYYKDLKKSKHKNETGTDLETVELIRGNESDEKKLPNYENINNSEENKSEDLSQIIVATPRKRKQKNAINSKAKEQSGLVKVKDEPDGGGGGDQHIYEEIIPCSTGNEEDLKDEDVKVEIPTEHIYDELQQAETQNKFLQRVRSSLFRLWSAVTPWAVARRVFWRGTRGREETELSRPSSRIRLNQNKIIKN